MMFRQRFKEVLDIVLSEVPTDAELANDLIDNFRSGRPGFNELEDPRSDEVEVKHLALSDIEEDSTVLAMGAAHRVRDSVHREPHLLHVWAHSDMASRLKTRKKRDLSAKRHGVGNLVMNQ
jgi:hypothetical protein